MTDSPAPDSPAPDSPVTDSPVPDGPAIENPYSPEPPGTADGPDRVERFSAEIALSLTASVEPFLANNSRPIIREFAGWQPSQTLF